MRACHDKVFEANYPVCHEFIFTDPVKALRCGHVMHSACFEAYTCSHYTLPICSKSLGNMTVYFGMLDALLAAETLPEEHQEQTQLRYLDPKKMQAHSKHPTIIGKALSRA